MESEVEAGIIEMELDLFHGASFVFSPIKNHLENHICVAVLCFFLTSLENKRAACGWRDV